MIKNGNIYKTNSHGFRDDEINPKSAHIIFLGDSTTFGLNINHEDTYPEAYEAIARKNGLNLQSVNTATPGQGTLDQLNLLRNTINDNDFNIAGVVLGFYHNDFSDSYKTLDYQKKQKRGGFLYNLKMLIRHTIGIPRLYRYLIVVKDRLSSPSTAICTRSRA